MLVLGAFKEVSLAGATPVRVRRKLRTLVCGDRGGFFNKLPWGKRTKEFHDPDTSEETMAQQVPRAMNASHSYVADKSSGIIR